MGFVPMQFSFPHGLVWQTHQCNTLELPLTPAAIQLAQPGNFSNGIAGGNELNIANVSGNFPCHSQ